MEHRADSVVTPDGSFDMFVWMPDSGSGPGLLLIQEIYGVSDYVRAVGVDLAGLGYVVGAPDMFWRLKARHVAPHDEAGLKESIDVAAQFDFPRGIADAQAAFGKLAALPEVEGTPGVIGFCFGGSVAFVLAARANPAVVLSFYGSAVPDQTGLFDQITCPLQLHFGGSDSYIPRAKVRVVEEAAAGRPTVEMWVEEDAGHAFHNRMAPMFYQPDPAARAWQRAEEFLRRHLPARQPAL